MFKVGDIVIAYGNIPSSYTRTTTDAPCKVIGVFGNNIIRVELLEGIFVGCDYTVNSKYFKLYKLRKPKKTKNHLRFKIKNNEIEVYKNKKLLEKVDSIIVGNVINSSDKEFDAIPLNKLSNTLIYHIDCSNNSELQTINNNLTPSKYECLYINPKGFRSISTRDSLSELKNYLGY